MFPGVARMNRFRLSNLFWLVLSVAIIVCWWKEHRRLASEIERMEQEIHFRTTTDIL